VILCVIIRYPTQVTDLNESFYELCSKVVQKRLPVIFSLVSFKTYICNLDRQQLALQFWLLFQSISSEDRIFPRIESSKTFTDLSKDVPKYFEALGKDQHREVGMIQWP